MMKKWKRWSLYIICFVVSAFTISSVGLQSIRLDDRAERTDFSKALSYIETTSEYLHVIGNPLAAEAPSTEGENDYESQKKEAPKIAITFDDGPSSNYTPLLLDGLKERNVKATFFLIGENVTYYPEIVKREFEEGHLIGNHTFHHVEITKVTEAVAKEEIEKTNAVIADIIGEMPQYMRPPFGAWQRNLEQEMSVMPVLWTVDPLDWTTTNSDEIVNKVVTQAKENDIILLHDCYKSSVDAALRIIDLLKAKGFEFVTAEELLLD